MRPYRRQESYYRKCPGLTLTRVPSIASRCRWWQWLVMYGSSGRDQKRSQQAFGKGSRKLQLGGGCSYRLSQANEASAGRRYAPQSRREWKCVQVNTQSVPNRVLESAQMENYVFCLRRGVVRGSRVRRRAECKATKRAINQGGSPSTYSSRRWDRALR